MKRVNNPVFTLKVSSILLFQIISIYLLHSQNIALIILGTIMWGLICAHSVQILHQCSHFTGFSNKRLNDFFGYYLGLLTFIDFKSYRIEHFKHHKNLGTIKDKEFFNFNEINSGNRIIALIPYIIGLHKYERLIIAVLKNKEKSSTIVLFLILTALSFLIYFNSWKIITCLALAYILIAEPVHFLIELPEHYECRKISKNKYENTRTIKNVSMLTGWFTNWNNFHTEHHIYQWVLPEKLRDYYNLSLTDTNQPQFQTYFDFYKFFIKNMTKSFR